VYIRESLPSQHSDCRGRRIVESVRNDVSGAAAGKPSSEVNVCCCGRRAPAIDPQATLDSRTDAKEGAGRQTRSYASWRSVRHQQQNLTPPTGDRSLTGQAPIGSPSNAPLLHAA